ncbi:MAG: hypothetical protein K2Y40_06735 [Reyranella sp.]|nr:hypothetical protein [Reyranella sp.]
MRADLNKLRNAMSWKGALAIAVAGTAVVGSAADAQADGWKKSKGYYAPGYVVVPPGQVRYYAPAPVIYAAPPPVIVYPAPVMYAPAYPIYAAPYAAPVGSLNFGITLPLR